MSKSDFNKKDLEKISDAISQAAKSAGSETEFQHDATIILQVYLKKLGITSKPHQNRTVITGRPDSLYGTVVIEYKEPGELKSETKAKKYVEQTQDYIDELVSKYPIEKSKYIGILIDGFQITFTKFRNDKWVTTPINSITVETIKLMFEYLRGLTRKPLHPDFILDDFGPKSLLAQECVQIFYNELRKSKHSRVKVLYEEWAKTFDQVCGYSALSDKLNIDELIKTYHITGKKTDLKQFLFAIHTYYTLIIKFLAAEICITYASSHLTSFLETISILPPAKLKIKVIELEEGGIFSQLGIKNFLEGDFFGWYLDLWNNNIVKIIQNVTAKLLLYEPATAALEPDEVRDLLKNLYQYLVPREIRHDLGEYFTPDWLAELTLDEINFDGNIEKKVLDPACGSGTFLILVIKRMRDYADKHNMDKNEVLTKILNNVKGFDLNPLAVIASRTNYLIALGELIRYAKTDIHIPVYLSDAISVSASQTVTTMKYTIRTSVGKFEIPSEIIEEKKLEEIFEIVDGYIKNGLETKEFVEKLNEKFGELSNEAHVMLEKLYDDLFKLEKKGINRIWTRVIKNAFGPFFSGQFDFVIGNPPWVNWQNLPNDYREITESLWKDSGLIKGKSMGKFKKDLAMLFVVISIKRYLSDNGTLGFLLPFTLTKTQAGSGYRHFISTKCKVLKSHELVDLKPFENATNRPSMFVLQHGTTRFPIKCSSWSRKFVGTLDSDLALSDIKRITNRSKLVLEPIMGEFYPESPWLIIDKKLVKCIPKIRGGKSLLAKKSPHKGSSGVDTGLNSAFWIEVITKESSGMLIKNLHNVGEIKLSQVNAVVEEKTIFPLIRGRDVQKWGGKPSGSIILLHDTKTGRPLDETTSKKSFPKTYSYFRNFQKKLEKRGTHKLMGKNSPFYSVYKIGDYTFAPHKVVWKHVSGSISGKGALYAAVISNTKKKIGNNFIIPDHSLMLIPYNSKDAAHFVCGVLNCSVVRLIVAGYTIETEIPTNIPDYVRIPIFEKSNKLYQQISDLSQQAHLLQAKGEQKKLETLEKKLDSLTAKIYGLNEEELLLIKNALDKILG